MTIGLPNFTGDAGHLRGVCFGGGSSSSSSSQSNATYDQRVGADNGAIVAQSGAQISVQSNDVAAVQAALAAAEQLGGQAAGVAVNAQNQGANVATAALSAQEDVLLASLGLANKALDASAGAASGVLNYATNITPQPASTVTQSTIKNLLLAGTAVAVVFFLSRGAK